MFKGDGCFKIFKSTSLKHQQLLITRWGGDKGWIDEDGYLYLIGRDWHVCILFGFLKKSWWDLTAHPKMIRWSMLKLWCVPRPSKSQNLRDLHFFKSFFIVFSVSPSLQIIRLILFSIWRFPMGVSLFFLGIFHSKPSVNWATPMTFLGGLPLPGRFKELINRAGEKARQPLVFCMGPWDGYVETWENEIIFPMKIMSSLGIIAYFLRYMHMISWCIIWFSISTGIDRMYDKWPQGDRNSKSKPWGLLNPRLFKKQFVESKKHSIMLVFDGFVVCFWKIYIQLYSHYCISTWCPYDVHLVSPENSKKNNGHRGQISPFEVEDASGNSRSAKLWRGTIMEEICR